MKHELTRQFLGESVELIVEARAKKSDNEKQLIKIISLQEPQGPIGYIWTVGEPNSWDVLRQDAVNKQKKKLLTPEQLIDYNHFLAVATKDKAKEVAELKAEIKEKQKLIKQITKEELTVEWGYKG
jgi:hypothetical protein